NSFVNAIDPSTGVIEWESDYGNRAHSQVVFYNGNLFSEDGNGNLYVFDGLNGEIIWKYPGDQIGLLGGIVAPKIDNDQVFWLNNYVAFGILGGAGPNGAVFKLNKNKLLPESWEF